MVENTGHGIAIFGVKSVDVVTKEVQTVEHKQQDGYEIKEVV